MSEPRDDFAGCVDRVAKLPEAQMQAFNADMAPIAKAVSDAVYDSYSPGRGLSGLIVDARAPLEHGTKFDQGKPGFELLPDDALAAIQKVLDFGAVKYDARNWEKGMNWKRAWNACLRHLWAWMRREECDPETRMSHLWHAGCCILFLIAWEMRKVGADDRPPAPPAQYPVDGA